MKRPQGVFSFLFGKKARFLWCRKTDIFLLVLCPVAHRLPKILDFVQNAYSVYGLVEACLVCNYPNSYLAVIGRVD